MPPHAALPKPRRSSHRFGHYLLDFDRALTLSQRVRVGASPYGIVGFVAPEVVAVLHGATRMKDCNFHGLVGCHSDVWSLGYVLVTLLTGDEQLVLGWSTDRLYDNWEKKLVAQFDSSLVSTQLESLSAVTASCLSYDPKGRPDIADLWKCIRGSLLKSSNNALDPNDVLASEKSF
jgi:serine/threonine protein kinase